MHSQYFSYLPIGIIRSEHTIAEQTPVQPVFAADCKGMIEISPEYAGGLDDLDGFSHIYLIYHMHQAGTARLHLKPFLQDVEHEIFATRAPYRPNPIGMSVVELVCREHNILHVRGVDILDGTPLLDIKPYSAKFDHIIATRSGWLDDVDDNTAIIRGRREYDAK